MTIQRGGSPRPIENFITSDDKIGINWVKIGDVKPGERYIYKTNEKIIPEGVKHSREVFKGDLILSNSMSFGRPYIMGTNGCIHDGWLLIRDDKNLFDKEYLLQVLSSNYMLNQYKKLASGGVVNNLNSELVQNTIILLPKKEEQIKLGNVFQQIDNLITLHQRKCFCKKYSWEQRKFGEMADYKKGPFGSALKKEIFVPKSKDSVKVYEQQNAINKDWKLERYFITKEYANKLRNFETHSGDIIISCAGTIGEIYELPLFSEPGIINQALMRVRVDEKQINKDMYKIVFSNMIDDFSKEHSNGSAMKNIPPFADLKPMEVLIPKSSEQKEITDLFNNLDNLITLHQLKEMKRS